MSTGTAPREDAELEEFLVRQSPLSTAYRDLPQAAPPTTLDDKILAAARVVAKSVTKPLPRVESGTTIPVRDGVAPGPAGPGSADTAERRKRPRHPKPEAHDDHALPRRRPAWLVPVALVVGALMAVGLGLVFFTGSPSGSGEPTLDSSLFAKRARAKNDDSKAVAAASAEQDAEVVELERAPLPPPPIFAPEVPQIEDLDAAIAMIRKELLLANQRAIPPDNADAVSQALPGQEPTAPAAALAATATAAGPDVVQPRERRLTKILELYDGGNHDLAGDSLEIFLRDFADDPISQRILGVKP